MKAQFEMDCHGNFRIEVDGKIGNPALYEGIATVEVDGVSYIGVSANYEGTLPIEQVLQVKKVVSQRVESAHCNLFQPDVVCTHQEV